MVDASIEMKTFWGTLFFGGGNPLKLTPKFLQRVSINLGACLHFLAQQDILDLSCTLAAPALELAISIRGWDSFCGRVGIGWFWETGQAAGYIRTLLLGCRNF